MTGRAHLCRCGGVTCPRCGGALGCGWCGDCGWLSTRDRDASSTEDAKRLSPEGVASRAAESGIAQDRDANHSGVSK